MNLASLSTLRPNAGARDIQRILAAQVAARPADCGIVSTIPDLTREHGNRRLRALDDRAVAHDHTAADAAHTFAETEPA